MISDDRELQRQAARADALLAEIESLPNPGARATAIEAIQVLAGLYGEGLARLTAIVTERDPNLLDIVADDEWIAHLLVLHDLHPRTVEERVARALDEARPSLQSHGGDVELIAIEGGTVRVRLLGSCHGCSASSTTLTQAIEDAVRRHAPDLDGVVADGVGAAQPSTPAGFIPLTALRKPASSAAG